MRNRWSDLPNQNTFVFSELSLFPDIRQPLAYLCDGCGGKIGQQLREIQFHIDLVAAAGAGHASQDGGGLAAADRPHKQEVLSPQGNTLHFLFRQVIIHAYRRVSGEDIQRFPLVQTIPTVADRIVQGAIRHVIEPIFEQQFAQHSYGFRPGRGCKDALRRVDQLLQSGYEYVVDADLKSYFDTIPHDRLMQEMQKSISDGRLLKVIESFLHANIMDGLSSWKPTSGAPQGAVLSPLLSNIYLNALDHLMVKHGMEMVRYADDFVILCRSAQEAQRALEMVQAWTAEAGLTLHPEKTRIVHAATESFDFLGYRFNKGIKYPRPKSLMKLRDAIREKTRRTHGQQLEVSISSINRVLRGWFGYFQHSYRTTFKTIDSWIRMRLRSILRKRRGGRGRGRGRDHQRWLNAYFKDLGLYSLVEAHRLACESLKRVQRPESRMR